MRSIVILSTAANLAFTGPIVVGLPWLVLVRFGGDASRSACCSRPSAPVRWPGCSSAGSMPRPRRFGSIVLAFVLAHGRRSRRHRARADAAGRRRSSCSGIGAMNGYVNVVVIAWVQGRTDPEMLGRTMSFLMLGSVVAAPLSLALAAVDRRHPCHRHVRRGRPPRRRGRVRRDRQRPPRRMV